MKGPRTEAQAKARQRKLQKRWRELHPNYWKEWQVANREYVTKKKRIYRARKNANR